MGIDFRSQMEKSAERRALMAFWVRAVLPRWTVKVLSFVGVGCWLPRGTEELAQVMREASRWYEANRSKNPQIEKFPQYGRIRQIGLRLHESGGLKAMLIAGYFVRASLPDFGYNVSCIWDGIGEWRW